MHISSAKPKKEQSSKGLKQRKADTNNLPILYKVSPRDRSTASKLYIPAYTNICIYSFMF